MKMRHLTLVLAIVGILGLGSIARGATKDSSEFESGWEFDYDPTAGGSPEWVALIGDPASVTTVDTGAGICTMTAGQAWAQWDAGAAFTTDWTVEFKARIPVTPGPQQIAYYGPVSDTPGHYGIVSRPNAWQALKMDKLGSDVLWSGDTSIWRTVRVTREDAGGGDKTHTLYVDNALVGSHTGPTNNDTRQIAIGWGDATTGSWEMDYYRYTTAGAYEPQLTFQDRTASLAPGLQQGVSSLNKASWGDYNNDGYVDLVAGGQLWRNNGGTSFTSVDWPGGPSFWGDFDNDGLLDLFNLNGKFLYRNNGSDTSPLVDSGKIPPFGTHVCLGATWADFNNDGYLDLYVGGYEDGTTYPDKILTYNKVTEQFDVAWSETVYPARGVTAADFDRDGDQDVYVSNYRLQPNRLWSNDGTGVMTDVAPSAGVAGDLGGTYPYGHTIGSAWGDFDNDGNLDLFVGNFRHDWGDGSQDHAKFYRNLGGASGFVEMAELTEPDDWQESYASPALGDYDNDGDLDLFFTTVYEGDYPRLYRNDGNWTFTDVTAEEGLAGLGPTYQAAWADFDNDGDLDLVTDGKIFVNSGNSNHYLKVKLTGDGIDYNTAAIGAEVRINIGDEFLTRQVEGGTGEGNQNDLTLHFGLGDHFEAVDLQISMAGQSWLVENVMVDQTFAYMLAEPAYLLGDANLDGLISADDYASVQSNYGNTGSAGGGLLGDANHDGLVGADDYASIQANFGNTSGGGAVPEPATMGLLAIGLMPVLRRRSK